MERRLSFASMFVAGLFAAMLAGCATFGTYETAKTTPRGGFAFGGAITPVHAIADVEDEGDVFVLLPLPELSGRYGITDDFELGLKWGFGPGMTFTGKYRVLRGGVEAALSNYASFYGIAWDDFSFALYSVNPRFIISGEAPGKFPFSASAGVSYAGVFSDDQGTKTSGNALSAVGGLGLPFRLGAERRLRIMPELSVSVPLMTNIQADEEESSGIESLLGHFVVSLGIGMNSVPLPR